MPVTLTAHRPFGLHGLARQLVHLAPVVPLILTPHEVYPMPEPQDQGIWRRPAMARTAVDWDPPAPSPALLGTARARQAVLDVGAAARRTLPQIMADEGARVFAALDRIAAEGWDVPEPPPVYRRPVPGRPFLVAQADQADTPPLRGQTGGMVYFDDAVDWGAGDPTMPSFGETPEDPRARVQMPPAIARESAPAVSMGAMYAVSEPENVGRRPVRAELTGLPADESGRRPLRFTVRERPGIAAYNLRAVSRLEQPPREEDQGIRAWRVGIPEFAIVANPQFPLNDLRARRFDLLDRGGMGSGTVELRGLDSDWIALLSAQKAARQVIDSAVTALLARRQQAV